MQGQIERIMKSLKENDNDSKLKILLECVSRINTTAWADDVRELIRKIEEKNN